jgi:hypothetical protein
MTSEQPTKSVRLLQQSTFLNVPSTTNEAILNKEEISEVGRQAIAEFGSKLRQAMNAPWERAWTIDDQEA